MSRNCCGRQSSTSDSRMQPVSLDRGTPRSTHLIRQGNPGTTGRPCARRAISLRAPGPGQCSSGSRAAPGRAGTGAPTGTAPARPVARASWRPARACALTWRSGPRAGVVRRRRPAPRLPGFP
jgi:hypothetical protein